MIHPPDPVYAIGLITGIGAIVGWLVGAVVDIATAVAAALAAVWAAMLPILVPLWHGLSAIWGHVLLPAWDKLKGWGLKVYGLYKDHVKPIVDKIQRITKAVRKVYNKFIQPVRDLIGITEQFLRLTHLDRTAFGHWLDGELHRVDSTIAVLWAELTKPLNAILRLINEVILDAEGLLQAPLLLGSTAKYMGHITAQWWDTSLKTITTDWDTVLDQFHTGPGTAEPWGEVKALLKGDSSALTQHVDHGVAVARLMIQEDFTSLDYLTMGVGDGGATA